MNESVEITSFGQSYRIYRDSAGLDVVKISDGGADMSRAIFNLVFDAMESGESFNDATAGFSNSIIMAPQNF
jgi:hypothetical protein